MLHCVVGIAAVIAALMMAPPAWADYVAGQQAWKAGRFAEALSEWEAAAADGDGRAMMSLGHVYRRGVGAPQDYILAHVWFNLAASQGDAQAAAERDALAKEMSVEEQAEARKLWREWRAVARPAAKAEELTPALSQVESEAGLPPPRAIKEAQALLAQLGYAPGPADGMWGKRTTEAYQTFLRDAGLPMAETLTPKALRAIRETVARQGEVERPAQTDVAQQPTGALHRVAKTGNIDRLETALKAGADVNARDSQGWTALMHVVNKGFTLLVPPLLEAKADLDMRAPDGATALFMASVHGHSEIIALLMEAGADISIRGPKGKTASDVAQIRYGGLETARQNNESSAVVALLQGKTLTEFLKAERLAREVGKTFRDCTGCPIMVVVPAGTFNMGSNTSEEGRDDSEGPVHQVTISVPFAVGKFEVTFSEWDACVAAGGCGGYRPDDEGWGRGNRPVILVSWEDANAFVRWLSIETGKQYRLLSESEWEYVARAGTTGPFHFGSTISTNQANYVGILTYGNGREGVYREKTVPVGIFTSNNFGLHDLHGNVSEWGEDCWHENYVGAPMNGSAWTSGGNCDYRVLRGGSWDFSPGVLARGEP